MPRLNLPIWELDEPDDVEAIQDDFVSRLYIFQARQLLVPEVEPSEKLRRKKKCR